MQVGFIGLGRMGQPMVERIAAAGHGLCILDADTARAEAIAAAVGARVAKSARDVAESSEAVVLMLPNSDIVEDVLSGDTGVLSGVGPGTVVVDMGSSHPMRTCALEPLVVDVGGSLVDAPVSGGVHRARSGQLTIMVGGAASAVARVEPVLKSLGDKIMPTGRLGSAHAMKALNNLVSAAGFLAGIEALIVGGKFGIDPGTIVETLNSSTGMNNSTKNKFAQFVLSGKYNSDFALDLMVKDVAIALSIAKEIGAKTPFSELCCRLWHEAAQTLGSGRDHTEIARWVQQENDLILE